MADEEFLDVHLPASPYGVIWHAPGTKTFFLGTDRGMLYIDEDPGVPWSGLVSVEESREGGDVQGVYIDGIRRRNYHYLEDFNATISAFSAPKEFGPCEGEIELAAGLFIGQQYRKEFGFSYRTFIGNDIGGWKSDYELNIIYGALAEPSSRTINTVTDSVEAETRSWEVSTVPEDIFEHNPSARIRLDSRYIDPERLSTIEYILYGTSDEPPRLPTITEIYEILSAEIEPETEEVEDIDWEDPDIEDIPEDEDPNLPEIPEEPDEPEEEEQLRRNLAITPIASDSWEAEYGDGTGTVTTEEDNTRVMMWTTPSAGGDKRIRVAFGETAIQMLGGTTYTFSIDAASAKGTVILAVEWRLGGEYTGVEYTQPLPVNNNLTTLTRVSFTVESPEDVDEAYFSLVFDGYASTGEYLAGARFLAEETDESLPYFDGDTEPNPGWVTEWIADPNLSQSTALLEFE